jgi:hypothetical protein
MRLLHAQIALETDKPPRLEIDVYFEVSFPPRSMYFQIT